MGDLLSRLPVSVTDYQPVVSHFDDATHCVYKLNSSDGNFALKLLKQNTAPFWRGIYALFGIQLDQQVAYSVHHYARAAQLLSLETPKLIDSAPACVSTPAYVLTAWLGGDSIDPNHIPSTLIESLASADAQRHRQQSMTWGSVIDPRYSMVDWQARVVDLLPGLSTEALSCLSDIDDVFVPMILDMRWDQCLQQQGSLSALVDIDALVYAPKALELVLMEYWLTPEQLNIWRETYLRAGGELPSVSDVRVIYRRLLWSWQILGSMTEAKWMRWPNFFD